MNGRRRSRGVALVGLAGGLACALWLVTALVAAERASAGPQAAVGAPVEHEPIPPDPREDLAMGVVLEGDLPAAIQTPGGVVSAPDPLRAPGASETTYEPGGERTPFTPDRNTRRPDLSEYDDPFTPATAPFKRLQAFDAVRSDYDLQVYDDRLVRVPTAGPAAPDEAEFFADLVVDVLPDRNVRIPSVGPGARLVRAHLGVGAGEVPFRIVHDGADNWFVQATQARAAVRARLVLQLAIAREAFGGKLGDPAWSDLPLVPPLPDNVAREAAQVRRAIGVNRAMRPRDAITKLVDYFRSFTDSDDPPSGRASVYLDLALSRKGVCRHRAFAFLVTAQSLGIPTRLVLNEAHAWVEIHDGVRWRRVDLGGAGRLVEGAMSRTADRTQYQAPADPFRWPLSGDHGADFSGLRAFASQAAPAATANGPRAGGLSGPGGPAGAWGGAGTASGASSPDARTLASPGEVPDPSGRPPSTVTLAVVDASARANVYRGVPLRVTGSVRADGEACGHAVVELWLRSVRPSAARSAPDGALLFGTAATGDDGEFSGGGVVPAAAPLGDYDVVATTPGDARCGPGGSRGWKQGWKDGWQDAPRNAADDDAGRP